MHLEIEIAPGREVLDPAGQALQATALETSLNVLAKHFVHIFPRVRDVPREQTHKLTVFAPSASFVDESRGHTSHEAALVAPVVDRKVFAGQSVHAAGPVLALYVPASHFTHTPSERV